MLKVEYYQNDPTLAKKLKTLKVVMAALNTWNGHVSASELIVQRDREGKLVAAGHRTVTLTAATK